MRTESISLEQKLMNNMTPLMFRLYEKNPLLDAALQLICDTKKLGN